MLDLASPKLLAAWLAEHTASNVVATDLWPVEVERWRRLIRAADPAGNRYRRLTLETADGTALAYPDASFDAAYSISVIEHIPGDGDAKAMSELARVLRPGALLVLTFPYRKQFEDEFVEHDLYGTRFEGEPIFFCRHYSGDAVQERLLAGGAFDVVERVLWRKEGVPQAQARARTIIPSGWPVGHLLGPVLPLLGRRAMRCRHRGRPRAEQRARARAQAPLTAAWSSRARPRSKSACVARTAARAQRCADSRRRWST